MGFSNNQSYSFNVEIPNSVYNPQKPVAAVNNAIAPKTTKIIINIKFKGGFSTKYKAIPTPTKISPKIRRIILSKFDSFFFIVNN